MSTEIERKTISRKQRSEYEAKILKRRDDLLWDNSGVGFEYFELSDGSILEIFLPEFPKESEIFHYKNAEDVLNFRQKIFGNSKVNDQFNGKTSFEILAISANEVTALSDNAIAILSNTLNTGADRLNLTKESLKYLDSYFLRVVDAQERNNNKVFKALVIYLAKVMKNELNGEIQFKTIDAQISLMTVIDSAGLIYNIDIGLPKIWVEGIPSKSLKQEKISIIDLFSLEVNKYRYAFKVK